MNNHIKVHTHISKKNIVIKWFTDSYYYAMNNDRNSTNVIVRLFIATTPCAPFMSDPTSTPLTGGLSSGFVVFGWFLSSALSSALVEDAVTVVVATVVAAYKESGEGLILIS